MGSVPTQTWQDICEEAIKAVVTILMYYPRPFDTEDTGCSEATGFVLDAKRGIILTNRHVAGPGPFRGRCLFQNQEEVDVRVLYYDPIHDYGFLKFDPKDVKRTTVTELRLRPDLAEVGQTIRVIGNDAGQKLNISEGIISRLNRNPPEYSGYRDFNINYIQGSAMTSGGSSGSPVIEAGGNVVALNGGSVNGAAVALFLPVEHPLKTLHHLIEDEVVPRGTLQAKWTHEAFHKCQNLGLPDSWVTTVQQIIPDETGMLVIKSVLPEGPADSILEEGDVILKVNGKLVTKFSQITKFLDCNVLKDISMTVQRWDKEIEVTVVVGDLHDITPNRYLMIGTTTFYDLSYQQAQRYRIPVRGSGVVSSEDGLFGTVPGDSMIQSVNGRKTKDLDAFVEVLQSIPDGTHLLVATKGFDDINKLEYNICILERGLYRMELASREPNSGSWQFADIITPPAIASTTPQKAALAKPSHPKYADAAYILHALVFVTTLYPLGVDGVTDSGKSGYGLIVNEELGLVLVSRQTIRSEFCTIQIRFHASIVVPGRVVFAHPTESFAVVKYDTSLVDAPVVRARLSSTETELGESGLLFYINTGWRLLLSSTAVAGKCVVTTDPDMQNSVSAVNSEVLTVGQSPGNYSGSGLISEDGTVQALYLGDYLTTVASIIPVLKQLEAGEVPQTRLLGARLDTTSLLQAITMGLPEDFLQRVENSGHRELFQVVIPYAGHSCGLEEGDIILELDDELVLHPSSVFKLDMPPTLQATILRDREVVRLTLTTFPTEKIETSRVILFCGAVIQQPYLAVRQSVGTLHSDVYVAACLPGSPFTRYEGKTGAFITHINGMSTPTLDSFLNEVNKIEDNTYFRLTCMNTQNIQFVKTLKRDEHYFPLIEYLRDHDERSGWKIMKV